MSVKILFKNVKRSESTDNKVHSKVDGFSHYFMKTPHVKWTCYKNGDKFWAEVTVHDQNNAFHAKANSENMFKSFDMVAEKMHRQLEKHSAKFKSKMHLKGHQVDFDSRPLHKRYAA